MNCLHKGCKREAVQGGQYCYYSHDGTISKPNRCLVERCGESTVHPTASNLCGNHREEYYLWQKNTDLSQITGENSLLAWLAVRHHLRGAR